MLKNRFTNKTKETWKATISVVTGVIVVFGVGYEFANYKSQFDFKVEKLELRQDYSERLQRQIDECKEKELKHYQLAGQDIEAIVRELKKRGYGK
ncbi:MAG: hypothetical protein ACK5NM_00700 [Cyclobacteriaceae bacterium]|jgi:hypothetical protein